MCVFFVPPMFKKEIKAIEEQKTAIISVVTFLDSLSDLIHMQTNAQEVLGYLCSSIQSHKTKQNLKIQLKLNFINRVGRCPA